MHGSAESSCVVVARTLCLVARFDLPHVIGKLLQRGTQPSLVVSFFLLFAFVHSRNPFHFRNERFDDLIDCLVDGHRLQSVATNKLRASLTADLHAGALARGLAAQRQLVRGNLVRSGEPNAVFHDDAPESPRIEQDRWAATLRDGTAFSAGRRPPLTPFRGKHSQLSLSVRSAGAAGVAESHLFRHSDSYLYSGAALS
jgi:hypothetical protein